MTQEDAKREAAIRAIQSQYESYERTGRNRRWSSPRFGDELAANERDAWLVASLADCQASSVIDAGCGNGAAALALDSAGARPDHYVGIDLITTRIEAARQRVPWGTFMVGSADRLPVPDASFDAAVALTLFSSIPDDALRQDVAKELDRVVKPTGCLLIYDIRYPSPGNRALVPITTSGLSEMFPGWVMESRSMTLLPPVARSALVSSQRVYALLSRFPPLRSHLGVRLIRSDPAGR